MARVRTNKSHENRRMQHKIKLHEFFVSGRETRSLFMTSLNDLFGLPLPRPRTTLSSITTIFSHALY